MWIINNLEEGSIIPLLHIKQIYLKIRQILEYKEPLDPETVLDTNVHSLEECVSKITNYLFERVNLTLIGKE